MNSDHDTHLLLPQRPSRRHLLRGAGALALAASPLAALAASDVHALSAAGLSEAQVKALAEFVLAQ